MLLQLCSCFLTIAVALLRCASRSIPRVELKPVQDQSGIMKAPRSSNTCADPTLARTVFQAFTSTWIAHAMNFHFAFVHDDTSLGTTFWTYQGPVFRAWRRQQPFTAPLFGLATQGGADFIFMVGANAETPPVVPGFDEGIVLVAWVYNSSVCGSVPLMSAAFPAQTDHYYTTDPDEHADLLAVGWEDSGVVAFVLPLE